MGSSFLMRIANVSNSLIMYKHVATVQVYGETSVGKESGCTETSTLEPTNPYSAAKAGAGDSRIPPMSSTISFISLQHNVKVHQMSTVQKIETSHVHLLKMQMHEQGSQCWTCYDAMRRARP